MGLHFMDSIFDAYFYPLGEEGERLAEEYDDAQSKMQPVDLTPEQWKEYQEWMSQFA